METGKNKLLIILIIILAITTVGLTGFIIYDKLFVKENNNLPEDNQENVNIDVDFKKLFLEAEELYSYYTAYNEPKYGNEELTDDDIKYTLVDDAKFKKISEMEESLKKYFAFSLADELLNTEVEEGYPLYKEVDGKVYRFGGFIGQYDYEHRENNLEVEVIDNDTVIIHNKITFYNDYNSNIEKDIRSYDYNLKRDSQGNFVFINFELPAALYQFA